MQSVSSASVSWYVSYCNFAGDTQLAYGYPSLQISNLMKLQKDLISYKKLQISHRGSFDAMVAT